MTVKEAERVLEDVRSWPITWPRKEMHMKSAFVSLQQAKYEAAQKAAQKEAS